MNINFYFMQLRFYSSENSDLLFIGQYSTVEITQSSLLFKNCLFATRFELFCLPHVSDRLLQLLDFGVSYAALKKFWEQSLLSDRIELSDFISMGYIE